MVETSKKVKDLLGKTTPKDVNTLKKQQQYYKRLTDKGIAQKQTYNLKPVSAI